MDIQFQNTDDLNATLVVNLVKEDYSDSVEKQLKKIQKQANVKGFRVGHAPMVMVKSMYGKGILADELNKLASEALFGYLKENNLDILAQPLPSDKVETKVNIDKDQDFTMAFDLGLAPKFDLNISSKDEVTKYVIEVPEEEVDKEIVNLKKRFGKLEVSEQVEETDVVYAKASELNEEGVKFEGGVSDKDISFTPELIKDEKAKAIFIGKKPGDKLTVNLREMFNDNVTVITNTLGLSKEAVNDLNPDFEIEITEIKRNIPAEAGVEFYNQVLGDGIAEDEETFRNKVKENIEMYYNSESEQHVEHMINHLIDENHNFELPDEFLKRWLMQSKEDVYNDANIDERYSNESKSLKYLLIQEKIAEKLGVKVEREDIEQASLSYTLSMFRSYGMQNPDFSFVKKFSDDNLKKPEQLQQMTDIALRRKVITALRSEVSVKEKSISIEDFYKELDTHKHEH
ncbi:MAG: trigger factor [Bacteroidia bacterium]|nr:trigger factor [Bacteroidia bacterium]